MNKTISFVIPVYNEEKRLIKTVTALKGVGITSSLNLEKIIFVNDGSTDDTFSLLYKFAADVEKATGAKVVIATHPINRGKGYAIKQGMAKSGSDYTLLFDADMATPLTELEKFVPFMQKNEPVIIGTRKNGESTVIRHQPLYREAMGRVFTLLAQLMLNTWVTDFTCGFKAFSREAKDNIFPKSKIDRWGYDSEVLFLARSMGYSISEQAVRWADDRDSKVNVIQAVFTSFSELMRIRFYSLTGQYSQYSYARRLAMRLGFAGN